MKKQGGAALAKKIDLRKHGIPIVIFSSFVVSGIVFLKSGANVTSEHPFARFLWLLRLERPICTRVGWSLLLLDAAGGPTLYGPTGSPPNSVSEIPSLHVAHRRWSREVGQESRAGLAGIVSLFFEACQYLRSPRLPSCRYPLCLSRNLPNIDICHLLNG